MARRYLFLALLLFAVPACDTNEPDPPPATLAGRWTGEAILQGTSFVFEMNLSEQATVVTGAGIMRTGQTSAAFTVDGSHTHPLVNLRVLFLDRPPITLTGMVSGDRDQIQGELSGSGFGGEDIVLERQ